MSAENFEPVKVVDDPKDVDQFQLSSEKDDLGELGRENHRLSSYVRDQQETIERHLNAFKKQADSEYSNWIMPDNDEATDQALQDYADEMNQILELAFSREKKEEYIADLERQKDAAFESGDKDRGVDLVIEIDKLEKLQTVDDIADRYSHLLKGDGDSIGQHFDEVEAAFGPELEKWINLFVNRGVEDIIDAADERAGMTEKLEGYYGKLEEFLGKGDLLERVKDHLNEAKNEEELKVQWRKLLNSYGTLDRSQIRAMFTSD